MFASPKPLHSSFRRAAKNCMAKRFDVEKLFLKNFVLKK
jgi:hypothetical protein